ncbi:putative inorganic phosphate cotransporter isoform X1 [Cydia pomonella]|uniref:putative inorganic phosphate cotransporter isoform X1 n=1 Tax=Cydia pomonella TaxID=82600 RepID=UPI002ADE0194|nr:putative inorganic phosphate cotransporter isoform X1 [Cydia pomonella]
MNFMKSVEVNNKKATLFVIGVVPVRFNVWVMLFTSCWVAYMLRVNMSLNIIAMVPQVESNTTSHSQCNAKDDPIRNETLRHADIADVRQAPRQIPGAGSFDWSPEQQAMILGSYFWCYPVTSLVGGMAAERWGPRYVVLITSLLSGLLTILSPAAARLHYVAIVVVRFILGIAGGFIYPALHALIARWAPPTEKGKFVSAMMGGTMGTVMTWSVTGPLVEKFGWASAFYVPGVLTLIWCAVWWYIVADSPAEHPRISDKERKYIQDALGDKVKKSKGLPPFKSIVTSLPFLAMVILHYGNLWGLYFIMTVGPKFVSSVLGFQLSAAGVISALPYLARLFLSAIFGVLGDCILARNLMTTTQIRKFFCLFSHIIPGVFLILLVYAGCSTALSVALITLSMGANGAATLTNLQNHQDLAPNYAGSLYGIANAIGSTAGFFTPMITAYFTRSGNGFEQWRPVFFIGASVYIVAAVFFIFFGTGETQDWNFPKEKDEESDSKSKKIDLKDAKETPLSVISS